MPQRSENLERGVYILPYWAPQNLRVMVAISREHVMLAWRVYPDGDMETERNMARELHAELNRRDPRADLQVV